MIASNRELNSPIEKSAIKCNRVNLPYEIYDLRDKLKALSPPISLRIDVHEKGEISLNNNWHDFESIDVSLILRDRQFEKINKNNEVCTEKPPTRLINAWSAGTIPIVDRTPSYAELISNGQDGFIVDNIDDEEELNKNKELFNGNEYEIDGKQLLLCSASKQFEQITDNEKYTFYHLVLETDNEDEDFKYGIWANGVLTETNYKNNINKPGIEVY